MSLATRSLRLSTPLLLPGILALACIVAAADVGTGPLVQFPILYVIPVVAAAWFAQPRLAIAFALLLPLMRAAVEQWVWAGAPPMLYTVVNTTTYAAVLLGLAGLTTTTATALRRVVVLEGVLPICSVCKRIRSARQQWEQLESYITRHSHASFSHGMCPDCLRRVYGNLLTS